MPRGGLVLLTVLLSGCGSGAVAPTAPTDTGAQQCALEFFEAIVAQNWEWGYGLLDSRIQSRYSRQEFTQRARNYRAGLGFNPDEAKVEFCAESRDDATARVVLSGRVNDVPRHYKDAVSMHRSDTQWFILLPDVWGVR
jgi:hypothetical protein